MNTSSNEDIAARLLADSIIATRQLLIVFSIKDGPGHDRAEAMQSVKHALKLLEEIKAGWKRSDPTSRVIAR
jgi:hypothetical protein